MTWEFQANVGISQAYFRSDAYINLKITLIFVGITLRFRLIDTARRLQNSHMPLASVRVSAFLIQHAASSRHLT